MNKGFVEGTKRRERSYFGDCKGRSINLVADSVWGMKEKEKLKIEIVVWSTYAADSCAGEVVNASSV